MTKPVILTGIRANNELTIGNYFGAIMPMIDMAKSRSSEYQINMFIPDLHSFTTPINHDKLQDQIKQTARLFVAAGLPLDDDNIYLYRQSYVPAHSELTWILDCFTGVGQMNRMTQFKDKKKTIESPKPLTTESGQPITRDTGDDLTVSVDVASVGLFNYPVLMAADILLYATHYVPVGEDQTQHLEFTRDIAERMNSRFGELFVVPMPVKDQHVFFGKDQGLRIKDLVDPTKKMSKSDETGKGVIFLADEPSVAAKKIMSATTDDVALVQYDPQSQPGISNLLEILALLRARPVAEVAAEFEGETLYGDFKKVVATEVEQFLSDFQSRLSAVDDARLRAKLASSEAAMNEQANQTLLRVQQAVGLRPRV